MIATSKAYVRGGTQKDIYAPDELIEVACPLCASTRRKQLATEHQSVGVSECLDCELVYTSPRLISPERVYWGDIDTYFAEARMVFEGRAAHHRDPNYLTEIRSIERYKKGGRFLDVGCNMGMLLRLAVKRGWAGVGVEPSPALSELARKHGFPVHNCFLSEVPKCEDESFDVVAFSDVFEHITDPVGFLRQAARLLKPDGVLYVKVPNVKWSLFKQKAMGLARKRVAQGLWDSYEHVVHYSDKTLTAMLRLGGFKTLEIGLEPPIQIPNWHEYVGHYFQYPAPFLLDWKRQTGRALSYYLSLAERRLRFGSVGYLAPNLAAIAAKA